MDHTEKLFKELTEAVGLPGFEEEVAGIMAKHLSPFAETSYDRLGSLIARKRGTSDGPKILLAGHMDEIGFMVKGFTKQGYIKFQPLGGWWSHVLLAQRVIVRTAKGDVVGVVGAKAPHDLKPDERRKLLELDDMYMDVGVTTDFDAREKLGVRPGDPIVPVSPFTVMNNGSLYMGKAWDDRVGCAMIVDILKALSETEHPNTVFGVGTAQEEVGLRGATTSAYSVDPDVGFALEVSIARDTPGSDEQATEKLGAGVSILIYDGSMIPNRRLRDLVIATAEAETIPYHFSSIPRGGTDSGRIHLSRRGVPSLTIGVPTRYIHSHVGILRREDYDQAVKLMIQVVKKLDSETVSRLTTP